MYRNYQFVYKNPRLNFCPGYLVLTKTSTTMTSGCKTLSVSWRRAAGIERYDRTPRGDVVPEDFRDEYVNVILVHTDSPGTGGGGVNKIANDRRAGSMSIG